MVVIAVSCDQGLIPQKHNQEIHPHLHIQTHKCYDHFHVVHLAIIISCDSTQFNGITGTRGLAFVISHDRTHILGIMGTRTRAHKRTVMSGSVRKTDSSSSDHFAQHKAKKRITCLRLFLLCACQRAHEDVRACVNAHICIHMLAFVREPCRLKTELYPDICSAIFKECVQKNIRHLPRQFIQEKLPYERTLPLNIHLYHRHL